MKIPRAVTGEQAVRALRRLGFEDIRQTGSHRILRQGTITVVVPMTTRWIMRTSATPNDPTSLTQP